MTMDLPVATDGAAPLTGPVRTEFIVAQEGQTTLPLSGWVSTRSHPTVSRDTSKARLTRRRYPDDERAPIAPEAWQFARLETGVGLDFQGAEHAIVESDTHIYMPGRIRARLDLRAGLRGPRSAGSGLGPRGGARPRELPEVRGGRQRRVRQSGGGRRADGEGLRLRPLADGTLHPRRDLARLQRRCRRPQGVRRRAGARRRLRAHVDEPPLRQRRRAGGAAVRGPRQRGRLLPVLLRGVPGPPDRQD